MFCVALILRRKLKERQEATCSGSGVRGQRSGEGTGHQEEMEGVQWSPFPQKSSQGLKKGLRMILTWEKCFLEPVFLGPAYRDQRARLKGLCLVVLEYFLEKNCRVASYSLDFSSLRSPFTVAMKMRISGLLTCWGEELAVALRRRPALMLCVSPSLLRSEYWGFLCLVHSAESHGDLELSGKGVP